MKYTLISLLCCVGGLLRAEVSLPSVFSDHLVLLKDAQTPVWGRAEPGEQVTVAVGEATATATTGADGRWQVRLDLANSSPGPFEMKVRGKNELTVRDVLVGEVWLGGGQSNMAFSLGSLKLTEVIAADADPLVRQFIVAGGGAAVPKEEVGGRWVFANPKDAGAMGATPYFFARQLRAALGAPVGVINTPVGGTRIVPWTSFDALSAPERAKAQEQQAYLSGHRKQFADYRQALRRWVEQTNRQDAPTPELPSGEEGAWQRTAWPHAMKTPGIVWLRLEVVLPERLAGKPLLLHLGEVDGFEQIFWDGKLISQTTLENESWPYTVRGGTLPPSEAGRHTLLVRIYHPSAPPKGGLRPRLGGLHIAGEWQAKVEKTFAPAETPAPLCPPTAEPMHKIAGALFNGRIHPFIPFGIRGVIWYQGEADSGIAEAYQKSFPRLIADWRAHWKQPTLPFYYCQLANYRGKTSDPNEEALWANLRAAQSLALGVPHTGQAVLLDVGEAGDIHPRNKETVGDRLSRIALAKTYGRKIAYTAPTYASHTLEPEGKVRLRFSHEEEGLVAQPLPATYDVRTSENKTAPLERNRPQSELEGFAICGADGKWVWADAKVEGNEVVVWSEQVLQPVAVRYAWANNPTCNLYSRAGLPVAPFRTDFP